MKKWFRQFPQELKYPILLLLFLISAVCRGIDAVGTLARPAIRRRGMAVVISVCMVVTMLPMQAFATKPVQNVGSLCEHHTEHTPECSFVDAVEGAPCGFTPDVPEEASPSNAVEQVAAPVVHIHDEECGYIEAVEGVPCGFVCKICNAEEKEPTVDNSVAKQQPALLSDVMPITDTGWVLDESGLLTISTPEGMNHWVRNNSTSTESCKAVKELVLEDAVTVIPGEAFMKCTQLTSVTGKEIVTIGGSAFKNNSAKHSLTTADFPNAVTIGNSAFFSCFSLTTVNFPKAETIGEMAFYEAKLSAPAFPSVTKIGKGAFACIDRNGTSLKSISLPNVTDIGSIAFSKCTKLAEISLPATPPTTADDAFKNCANPRNLKFVDENGTELTDKTAAVEAYSKATGVADGLWYGWIINKPVNRITVQTDDAAPVVGASLKNAIGDKATTLKKLEITGGNFLEVDWNYLKELTAMETFIMADTVTTVAIMPQAGIHESVFPKKIKSVSIKQTGITALSNYAFYGCANLTDTDFPTITTIGTRTFNDCTSLTSVRLPKVASIDEAAFDGCTTLASLSLPAKPPKVQWSLLFNNCPATRALTFVDGSEKPLTDDALTKAQMAYKAESDDNVTDNFWYGWDIGELVVDKGWAIDTDGNLTITTAAGMTDWVANGLNANTDTVKTATIAEAVTKIPEEAFLYCGQLEKVTATSVTEIGTGAFKSCSVLTSVTANEVTGIGEDAFYACEALTGISFPKAKTIGSSAFMYCGLSTLTLGATPPIVLNTDAFIYCPTPRSLALVGTDGKSLAGDALTKAQTDYKAVNDGDQTDNFWYGWTVVAAPPTTPTVTSVTVTPNTANVQKGATQQFTAAVTGTNSPAQTVTWKVTGGAKAGTAISKSGLLTVAADETATSLTITATSDADNTKSGTAAVTVAATVPVTGVTLSKSSISLYSNTTPNTETLTATITPSTASNQEVLWSSGNTSVATVANGVVTAVGNGTTSITVTTSDGGKTASCTVKVSTYRSGGGSSSDGGSTSSGDSTTAPGKSTEPVTGSSNAAATVDSSGNISVNISDENIEHAVQAAKDTASKKGATEVEVTVVINVTAPANSNPRTVTVNLPKTVQDQVISGNIGNVAIVIDKPDIAISMNLATITEMNKQANGDIQLSATRTDATRLSAEAKNAIGSRPAFDLKATYENGSRSVTDFGTGTVSVAIPYTLQNGEVTGGLYAVYVDGNGNVNDITNSSYDAENKVLRFSTNHFSVYGIGYKAPVGFTDMESHWAKTDIEFAVNRGLMNGTSETTFSPDDSMTRGMFVTALGRLAGVDTNNYKTGKFTDVKTDAYYAPYVNWAADKGIVKGTSDTTFAPDQAISRQEVAVIMSNYASAVGYKVPHTRDAVIFADNASIASWAAAAVKQMQMAGILNGKNNNTFDPTGTATRGEISAMLHRYVERVIDKSTSEGWTINDSGSSMYYQNGKALVGVQTLGGVAYTFNSYGETTR